MKQINAHKMVADVAMAIANEEWEKNASNNEFYKRHGGDRQSWVYYKTAISIDTAREILLNLCSDDSTSQNDKIRIWEALTLDEEIPGSMNRVNQAMEELVKFQIAKQKIMKS